MRKTLYILITIISLSFIRCGGGAASKTEGIIDFKVTYPKMEDDNFMFDFMPKEMALKFKDNKYKTSLTAGMGMFKMNFIINPDENQFSQTVKLIDKKYSLTLKDDEITQSINKLAKYHVEHTGRTKKILDYVCEEVIITVDNEANDAFSAYYTDRIKIENPNSSNQFKDINGVLLEYQYEKYGICMRFEAEAIKFTPINDEEFDLDKEYANISESKMNEEMQAIFDSFK